MPKQAARLLSFGVRRRGSLMVEAALNLVVLRSADLERAARFYSVFGIRFERERHGSGPEHLAAHVGSVVLEVYPQGSEADSVGVRLGFQVSSVDTIVEAVLQVGGTVVTPPRRGPWGYRAVVADPDGRRVEVCESEKPESCDRGT